MSIEAAKEAIYPEPGRPSDRQNASSRYRTGAGSAGVHAQRKGAIVRHVDSSRLLIAVCALKFAAAQINAPQPNRLNIRFIIFPLFGLTD